jgi:uncharacterized membrane protein YccC
MRDDSARMVKLARYVKSHFIEQVELRMDGARAFRALVAFAVPVLMCHRLNQMAEAVFISTSALNLSLPDLRGAYKVRVGIMATLTLLAASSAFLGVDCAGSVAGAALGMGAVALGGGVWRHLSADYGPSMAVSSALLFLLGLSQGGGVHMALHVAELTALGGAFATGVHACTWLIRPQHGLRYAVAETWVAASDLVAAMRPGAATGGASGGKSSTTLEGELRAALDRTFVILGGAEQRKPTALITDLEEMRREVVQLTMRVMALNTSLESVVNHPDFVRCLPALDSALKSLSDAARSVAITIIMHRPENLAASGARLQRCGQLLKVLEEQVAGGIDAGAAIESVAQVRAATAQVAKVLPGILTALERTTDHGKARVRFAATLPELSRFSIGSFAGWMRPVAQFDSVLIRHSGRMAVFTMLAVALYEGWNIPRGYWIAFTIMVVLQPDYGSTRQRAAARIGGTVGGIVLAGCLLELKLPLLALDAFAAAMAFVFAYFLKRRYWLAIFFITINLVLITETVSPVNKDFMVARIIATLVGGGLALVAARVFWPAWEGEKFPTLVAKAVRANQAFLLSVYGGASEVAGRTNEPLMARRRAENANRNVAASVERLQGEPAGIRENPDCAAALATYCQRITRALNVLAVQMPTMGKSCQLVAPVIWKPMGDLLEQMAQVIEDGCEKTAVAKLEAGVTKLEFDYAHEKFSINGGSELISSPGGLAWMQLGKTIAELRAMTLGLKMQTTEAKVKGARV